ncbi:L-aminoadipate-semialdehyde dehydrogenase-phosphopantetheinyl transferase [Culicoides brevitarsis]|uniref:L-aminoadipate-semialdehyde dehydrogenase-phosphopantetheinyl transferase n=1 Tax=Culicoides brevitarsis TaxID=469753 RepID=UPI00307BB55C
MKSLLMSSKDQIRWAFNLKTFRPSLEDLLKATSCIQAEEKTRLAKFVFRDDFDASLIGRLLMRKFVHETTNTPYSSIKFERDSNGKPYFAQGNVDFNVSHQGSYSVLAGIGNSDTKTAIGVDVMKIEYTGGKSLDEFFRIMTRNFSSNEWEAIKNPSEKREKVKNFMRHWCLKESYVKNIGVGITIDLQKISFTTKEPLNAEKVITSTCLDVNNIPETNFLFEESLLDDDHIVAVALKHPKSPNVPQKFQILTFNELMEHSSPLLEHDIDYCKAILAKEYKRQ